MAVGSSAEHTPIKHALLKMVSGQIAGAASKIDRFNELLVIDACAGSGNASIHSGTSSPEILCGHLDWASSHGLKARGYFVEKHDRTVELLARNIGSFSRDNELFPKDDLKQPIIEIFHGDYRSPGLAMRIGPRKLGVTGFLHIDPNHANDVELSGELLAALPTDTTMLVTLGCNANGIKRLPAIERIKWFDRVNYLFLLMRRNHDACLIQLQRDKAQWAYLLTVPKVWRDRIGNAIPKLAKLYWAKGVISDWHSDSNENFWKAASRLFLKVDGSEQNPI